MSCSSLACGGGGAERTRYGASAGPTRASQPPPPPLRAVPLPRCAGADIQFHIAESQAASAEMSSGVIAFIRSVMPGLLPRAPLLEIRIVFSR